MYSVHNRHLTFVIFDGITNSVFKSQVLEPLLRQIEEQGNLEVTLISFERHHPSPELLMQIIPPHNMLHVVICPRTPFMGHLGLTIAGYYFARAMQTVPLEKIVARGPLAGWIVLHWLKSTISEYEVDEVVQVVIQARGLAAEEYRYTCEHEPAAWYWGPISRWYYRALRQIEFEAYRSDFFKKEYGAIEIEAVSPALKEYVEERFEADPQKVSIAQKDLVPAVPDDLRVTWREQIRHELGIPAAAYVYCYSGSAKPWQCARESVAFAAEELKKNPNAYLLILSTDTAVFEGLLHAYEGLRSRSLIRSVDPRELLRYLCAADVGLLFRHPDIVNWVARPTKALEYRAAGLEIIHNNTVEYLRTLS